MIFHEIKKTFTLLHTILYIISQCSFSKNQLIGLAKINVYSYIEKAREQK